MDIANPELCIGANTSFIAEQNLFVFEQSLNPVWVFDIKQARVVWANRSAIQMWDSQSPEELYSRDMGKDMSPSVRKRLQQYVSEFWNGKMFDETWTLFPKGKPKTVFCRFKGCMMNSGNLAMLCEATSVEDYSPLLLRSSQALLYTDAMVSIYDDAGKCIYSNPAALEAFSAIGTSLEARILSADVLKKLFLNLSEGTEGHYLSSVMTQNGKRKHEIDARKSYDTVTGSRTLLLTEVDVTDQEAAKQKAEQLANYDFLTGLHNRQYLVSQADQFADKAFRASQAVFVLLLDLDRFKFVNDTLGHSVGDEVLRHVASSLRTAYPRSAITTRLGGDEFCVLVRSAESTTEFSRKVRKLANSMGKPIKVGANELTADVSIGISHARTPAAYKGFDDLLANADLALYSAKRADRRAVRIYRKRLSIEHNRFVYIEDELRQALRKRNDHLSLHYQPIVCAEQKEIISLEALARLKTSSGEVVSPTEFIPIAETTGLIDELGKCVLGMATRSRVFFPDALKNVKISINVSPKQFLSSSLLSELRLLTNTVGFKPETLEIELTETAVQLEEERFCKALDEMTNMGFSLAIDDFGSAYSRIALLNGYPFKTLKIDRSLISKEGRRLAAGVINMGHALDLNVIAEGVETSEQKDWLLKKGCACHQGFLYSKPIALSDLNRLEHLEF